MRDVCVLQHAAHTTGLGVDREHRLPNRNRIVGAPEPFVEDHAHALQQLDPCGVVRGRFGAGLKHAGERLPVLLALCEVLEGVEAVDRFRGFCEDLLPQRDGRGVVVQPLGAKPSHLDLLAEPFLRLFAELRFSGEHRVERIPLPLLGVDVLELRQRFAVVGLELHHALQGASGLVHVAEALHPQACDAPVEVHLFGGRSRQLGLPFEHVDELVPPARVFVEADEGGERLGVVRRQREDLAVDLDQHRIELQRIPIDRDQISKQPELFLVGLHPQGVDLSANRLREGVPLAAALVELLQRRPRVQIPRLQALDQLPCFERALGPVRCLRAMAELARQRELQLGVGRRAQRIAEDR